MDQLKDNIYDAYYSNMGEEFGKKVRDRVHWITQNVRGSQMLDVGCSQGITGILLGREGKEVLGLDASSSAIEDAKNNLLKEEKETQEWVTFEKANFFVKEFTQKFDTVILGEVLEHITDIDNFFLKASSLVKENGRIIVTTPFGINEFIDHKRTFYLLDLMKLKTNELIIEEVKFFGKWIGVIYTKDSREDKTITLNEDLLQKFEGAVHTLESDYLKNNKNLKNQVNVLKKQLKNKNEKNTQNSQITQNEDEKKKYLKEKAEKVKLQNELLSVYKENEILLKKNKKLLFDYESLLNRYHNLKNSKLGRLTTKYWQLRGKKRRK